MGHWNSCPMSGISMLPGLTKSVVSAQLVVPEAEFHGEFYSLFQYNLGCDTWLSFPSYPASILTFWGHQLHMYRVISLVIQLQNITVFKHKYLSADPWLPRLTENLAPLFSLFSSCTMLKWFSGAYRVDPSEFTYKQASKVVSVGYLSHKSNKLSKLAESRYFFWE